MFTDGICALMIEYDQGETTEYRHNHSNGSGGWHEAYCYKETNCGTNHGRPLLCVHDRHYCGGSYSADGCGDLDWKQVPV